MKQKIIYVLAVIISLIYIVVGNKIATKNAMFFNSENANSYRKVEIINILSNVRDDENNMTTIEFEGNILNKREQDPDEILCIQTIDDYSLLKEEVKVGDKIFVFMSQDLDGQTTWYADQDIKLDRLFVLGILFLIFLIIFGKMKGVNTIISLSFTCLSIFSVYIPAILSGFNIYIFSIITCIYIVFMTLIIVMGINKKSLVAGLGCVSGILVIGILTYIMSNVLELTGITDEHSVYLQYVNEENPINLKAIIFGAILIGAIGAIMDVAISIASSLKEVYDSSEKPTFKSIFNSGITIGRDMMGTMANTLVLAYIGSSLSVVLLLCAYNDSVEYLLNKEMIIVEMLQALVGSIGILLTIPLTTLISSTIYLKNKDGNLPQANMKKNENKIINKESKEMTESKADIFNKIDEINKKKENITNLIDVNKLK